ncbi:MAG TPA: FAD-binding protein, partial [Tepidisphaeraceae bacterium]
MSAINPKPQHPAASPAMPKMRIAQPFAGLEAFVEENHPLAKHTWYKIGGPARYYVRPRSPEDLQEAVARCVENNISIHVLGLGANLLVSDEGVNGAVFRFDQEHWRKIKFDATTLDVGSGVDMQKLIVRTVRQGLAGIEVLAGIPGTI